MKTKLIILFVLTTLSMMAISQIKETVPVQKPQNYTYQWNVKIHFNLPELNPEAIQIGLLDFDPAETFMQKFNMNYLTEQLKKANDEKEKTLKTNVAIKVSWDRLFAGVKGSELYLLTKDVFVLSTVADNTKPKAKKWLVSKMFYLDNKPYCYIIPLELENGTKLEYTLNSTNLTSLTDMYHKIKI